MNIKEVKTNYELNQFINFPKQLYKNDSFYPFQLSIELKKHFSEKNPFLRHNKVKFFLAMEGKTILGRIASIINYDHIRFHNEKVGFFGFFECINDNDVAFALLDRVSEEIKREDLEVIRGPMNFSTNEECGFLLEGFENPPMLMTPYNKPYYNNLMHAYGMTKSKDLYAFIYVLKDELPEKVWRVASLAEKKGIKVRTVKKKSFFSDMKLFQEIYNSAWSKNWGFIPLRDDELIYSAKRLKLIADFDLIFIAEKDGKAIGFLGLIPDFNFVLRKISGVLNLLTIFKILYYKNKISDLRLLLYGIKEEYRNKGVDALMFSKGREIVCKKNKRRYKRIEFSWILEDNKAVINLCELFGARLYKKYRIYEKKILSEQ